jgi:hypothetical protein
VRALASCPGHYTRRCVVGDVLYAGAIAVTHGWPVGVRVVEHAAGRPIALRAFFELERQPSLWPIPRARAKRAPREDVSEPWPTPGKGGQRVEMIRGVPFSTALLDAACEAWPGVVWALGKPDSIPGCALYGFVGKRLVACVAQLRELAEDAVVPS